MPKHKGYVKLNLEFKGSLPCIESQLRINNKVYKGYFLLDTGSDQAMILDSSWAKKQKLPTDLKLLKTVTFRDPRGVKYETKTVLCPFLELANQPLPNVPASLLGSRNPVDFEVNYLGNDVLKRFNTIFDFKNDKIYLKPNSLIGVSGVRKILSKKKYIKNKVV